MIYATNSSTETVLQEVGELCKHVVNVADDCFLGKSGWNMLEGRGTQRHKYAQLAVNNSGIIILCIETPKLLPMLFTPSCHTGRHTFALPVQALVKQAARDSLGDRFVPGI